MKIVEPESIKRSPFHPSYLLSDILTWEEERRPEENADCQRLLRQRLKSNEHHLARWAPVCSSSSIEVAGLTLGKVTQILHQSDCLSARGCRTTETFDRTVTPIGQICVWCGNKQTTPTNSGHALGHWFHVVCWHLTFSVDSAPQSRVQEEFPPTHAFLQFLLTQLFTLLLSLRNQGQPTSCPC
ncbi:hypothetical protein ACRRTK_002435 [Alexandromys fortis]